MNKVLFIFILVAVAYFKKAARDLYLDLVTKSGLLIIVLRASSSSCASSNPGYKAERICLPSTLNLKVGPSSVSSF